MTKRLLIIGAGLEQIKAYQAAKEMGIFVVGTDINPESPAFEYADESLICSTRDVEETLTVVSDYVKMNSINGVMTIANDVPLTVAAVASELGLKGISTESARIASSKYLMKKQFASHGIFTPEHKTVSSKDEFIRQAGQKKLPFILKPSDSRGSRGVLYIDECVDLAWAWDYSIQYSGDGLLLIEDFIPGPQLSVEGIFVDGKYMAVGFADRNYSNLPNTKPFIVEDGGIIPTRFDDEKLLDQIAELIEKAAKSIGISWGAVKGDIVLSEKGPQIIEVAARLSGNYLATHHIPFAYGVDIVSALIRLSLDMEVAPSDLVPKHKHYIGVRYFFPATGVIKKIEGIEEVRGLDYVKFLALYYKKGDSILPITDHTKRAGTVICEGPDYDTAKARIEDAVDKIKFVIE